MIFVENKTRLSIFFIIVSFLLWIIEPSITSFQDSIWYCFVASTTIGFGDIAATTFIGRILTIILSVYSLGVVAIFTGVITSYFMENAKAQAGENVRKFLFINCWQLQYSSWLYAKKVIGSPE